MNLLQNALIAEKRGYKWYWCTDGIHPLGGCFKWKLVLSLPPEGGIGKHWIGRAGETREATETSIEVAKLSLNFEYRGPNYSYYLQKASMISNYLLTGMHHNTPEAQMKIAQIIGEFV